MKKIYIFLSLFTLSACYSGNVYKVNNEKTSEEKVISYDSKGKHWGQEVERRLRAEGFKVVKSDSTKKIQEEQGNKKVSYADTSVRYNLKTTAKIIERCYAGGYHFEYFTAEFIDKKTNETVAYYEGAGYTENCFPTNGAIFEETVDMVSSYWN